MSDISPRPVSEPRPKSPIASIRDWRPSAPLVPWSWGSGLGVTAAAMACFVLISVVVVLPLSLGDQYWEKHHPYWSSILFGQLEVLTFGTVVFWLIVSRYRTGIATVGWRWVEREKIVLGPIGFVASYVAIIIVSMAIDALFPNFLQGNTQQTFGSVKHESVAQIILLLVTVALEIPLLEETIFRGVLYAGLRQWLETRMSRHWAIAAAAVASGFIFAAFHLEPHSLPLLFVLGVVLAYVYEYSGSILISALTHGLQNAIAIVFFVTSLH